MDDVDEERGKKEEKKTKVSLGLVYNVHLPAYLPRAAQVNSVWGVGENGGKLVDWTGERNGRKFIL